MSAKSRLFWPLAAFVALADGATKWCAARWLDPAYQPHDVIGSVVRFTLAFNTGAAMGLPLGPDGRAALILLTVVALGVLAMLYVRTAPGDRARAAALALVCGGAIGNLADRIASSTRGVVDFIDLGFGDHRFWTFNVADVGVSVGAILLAIVMWRAAELADAEIARDTRAEPPTP